MGQIRRITDKELNHLVNRVISESIEEGLLDTAKDYLAGAKGVVRGYGKDYFMNMNKLRRLITQLKKLDTPNEKVISELKSLKQKVSSLNMPQQRKDNLIALINNSVYHFEVYNNINDQILNQIKTLNLDKWQ
jgi:hypothetical protein